MCNSKPVRQICFTYSSVSPSTSSNESVFMIIRSTSTKTPKVTAFVNDSPVTFVLVTGASVNIISGRVYNGLKHRPTIHRATTRLFAYRYYLPTPPLGQDMTQGQFLSRVQQVWIQSFPSPRLVALPRLKNLLCPAIYP